MVELEEQLPTQAAVQGVLDVLEPTGILHIGCSAACRSERFLKGFTNVDSVTSFKDKETVHEQTYGIRRRVHKILRLLALLIRYIQPAEQG